MIFYILFFINQSTKENIYMMYINILRKLTIKLKKPALSISKGGGETIEKGRL